tara:strand:- start:881 stop:4369 length:3489 start_codon:yes stop_codon:yes gene_type:complete
MSEYLQKNLSLVQLELERRRKQQKPVIAPQEYVKTENFEQRVFGWLPDFIKDGYNNSITGMARELAIGRKPFDLEKYDPKILDDIGSSLVSFLMPADLVTTIAGGGVGGLAVKAAAKRAGTMATKQLLRSGVSKKSTRAIVNGGINRVVTGATGFGTYSGIASALSQEIQKGQIDYNQVLTEAGKGALLGAVTGGIGARADIKGTSRAVKTLQEGTAFGVISPVLEGRAPTPQDFVYSVGTVMGLGTAAAGLSLASRKIGLTERPKISLERKTELEQLTTRLAADQVEQELKMQQGTTLYRRKDNPSDVVTIKSVNVGKDNVKRFNLVNKANKSKSTLTSENFRKLYTTSDSRDLLLDKYRLYEVESGYTKDQIQTQRRYAVGDKIKGNIKLSDMDNVQLVNYAKNITADYRIREYKNKYLDLADLPQKTFIEHALPPSLVRFLVPAKKRAKALQSRVIVDNIEKADIATKLTFERYQNRIDKALRTLNDKDLNSVASAMENKGSPDRKISLIAKEVRSIYDDMYNYADSKGIKVAQYRQDYFPQMIKRSISEVINNDFMSMVSKRGQLLDDGYSPEIVKELNKFVMRKVDTEFSKESRNVMKYVMRENNLNAFDAYKQLQNELFVQQLSPFGNLEKKRRLNLPEEILERDALKVSTAYNMKLARRVEIASLFGRKGERAESLLKEIAEKNPSEARAMNTVWQSFTGQIESDPFKNYSPTGKKIAENVMAFEMGTKIALGTATIPNLSQFAISTAIEAGYYRTFKSAFKLLNKDYRKKLEATGSTYHNALDVLLGTNLELRSADGIKRSVKEAVKNPKNSLLNISNALATLSGFKGINYFNNLLAASTAEMFLKDLHRIANTSSIKARKNWAITNLKRFDIDPSKALSSEKLSAGMFKFARDSQLQKNILSDPIFFNEPKWRPFIIFKRFGYKQVNYINEVLSREVKAGNITALMRLGLGGVAGGYAVNKFREIYLEKLTGEKSFSENKEGMDFILDSMLAVGAFGVLGDIIDGEDLVGDLSWTFTPVVASDVNKLYDGLVALQKNLDTFGVGEIALRRSLKPIAPIFGSVPSRLISKLQTPQQKIETIKQRRSRIVSDQIDLLLDGRSSEAISNIREWNQKFPEFIITGDDINFQRGYQKIIQKALRVRTEEAGLEMENIE